MYTVLRATSNVFDLAKRVAFFPLGYINTEPVSYTHLDVYKRQEQTNERRFGIYC